MKTLITGASGFIGRALLRQNLTGELHVTSRVCTSLPSGITGHFGDLSDQEFVKRLAEQKFERVIHLAWEGLPNLSEGNNLRNLKISKKFLGILASSGVKEFQIAGSCLEYGDKTGQVDEGVIGENLSDFAVTKIKLLEFIAGLGVSYKWYRVFYSYGPFQHDHSLLSLAFLSAKNGVSLKLSNPNISRDFIYVDDVAKAMSRLIQTPGVSGIFNIGSGKGTLVKDLVDALNSNMGLEVQDQVAEESPALTANIQKITETCGWAPEVSIEQGVRKFVDWKDFGTRE
jgi:dTDP-6-deoxy-L-talose 4-dehydrogenase (NAD+)